MNAANPAPPPQQRKRRPPVRTGVGKTFYISPELDAALVAFIDSLEFQPTQTAIFECALEAFLRDRGFWHGRESSS